MGLCQSAPRVEEPVAGNKGIAEAKRIATVAPDSDSDDSQKNGNSFQYKQGYSSGASSSSVEEEDEVCARRDSVDRVGLDEIRAKFIEDGDLGCSIVRMETPLGKPIEEVYDGVHDGKVIGTGVAGIVRLVTHRVTGVKYAVKCLDLTLIKDEESLEPLRNEIYIMCEVDHPGIVRLEEVYESESEIYLIMQFASGGDLFDRLDEQPDFHYTEAKCARLVKQILSSVRYLHSKNIIHRDLKLENFIFSSTEHDSVLKLTDFGLSKHFDLGEVLHDAVGTPYAVAPEVIRGSYSESSDLWSIGVITYLLFCGETPFGGGYGEDLAQVRQNILRGKLKFEPEEAWEKVSDLGKDFVKTLLNIDPSKRPTAKEAQRHPWIHTFAAKKGKEGNRLNPKVVDALVSFKELSELQKLLSEVLSFTLLPEQIAELSEEFEKIDDGDGEITLYDLKEVLMENAEAGSLGVITEKEVEDIFQALRVRKTDTTIRWHEFIAAGLSQCQVDDRNLRLAFDRLDTDGKGFITLNDFMDMLGSNSSGNKEELQTVWKEAMTQLHCGFDRITFDEFSILMKGQSQDTSRGVSLVDAHRGSVFRSIPEDSEQKSGDENILQVFEHAYIKKRSRSLDETEGRRSDADLIETNSSLADRPSLFEAHREMRLAVLEACKRFDEKQAKRAQATLTAQRRPSSGGAAHGPAPAQQHASTMNCSVPNDSAEYRQMVLDHAGHRTGRHRKGQKSKTLSDISGFVVA